MTLSGIVQVITDLPWQTKAAGGSAVAGVVLILVWRGLFGKKHKQRRVFPQDTVVIHQIGRAPHVPSLTPFAIKLETFCRVAGIKYENVHGREKSPKGKWPWIEYKGEIIADSEFCIELINKEQGVDLNSHLSPEEKGIGRAIQKMLEENTYWTVVLDRWVFDTTQGVYGVIRIPWFMRWYVRSVLKKMTHAQGMGRHSKEEVVHILRTDLQALSNFLDTPLSRPVTRLTSKIDAIMLPYFIYPQVTANSVAGKKRFLFGDKACQYDCAVFGMLAEMRWESFGGFVNAVLKEFPNLVSYCDQMKEEFWPDWDDCTKKGRESKTKK